MVLPQHLQDLAEVGGQDGRHAADCALGRNLAPRTCPHFLEDGVVGIERRAVVAVRHLDRRDRLIDR
jgi:hypothetical protein